MGGDKSRRVSFIRKFFFHTLSSYHNQQYTLQYNTTACLDGSTLFFLHMWYIFLHMFISFCMCRNMLPTHAGIFPAQFHFFLACAKIFHAHFSFLPAHLVSSSKQHLFFFPACKRRNISCFFSLSKCRNISCTTFFFLQVQEKILHYSQWVREHFLHSVTSCKYTIYLQECIVSCTMAIVMCTFFSARFPAQSSVLSHLF